MGENESAGENQATQEASEAIAVSAKETDSARILEFFSYLPTAVDRQTIERFTTITPYGLFISEPFFGEAIEHYSRFLGTKNNGKSPAYQRSIRKLLGTETPALQYTIHGKKVVPGYLIEQRLEAPQKFSFPLYRGKPMDATDYIHPRDPLFEGKNGFSAELTAEGFFIYFKVQNLRYAISEALLREFALHARANRYLLQRFPGITGSLRNVLQTLTVVIKDARPLSGRRRTMIPHSVAGSKNLFLRYKEINFVIEKEKAADAASATNIIRTHFLSGGRSKKQFFFDEFPHVFPTLRRDLKKTGIYIPNKRGPFLFQITKDDKCYRVPAGTLMSYIDELLVARGLTRKLPRYFTLSDALKQFAEVFQDAVRVEPHQLQEVVRNGGFDDSRWFRRDSHVFHVTPAGVILWVVLENNIDRGASRYQRYLQSLKERESKRRGGGRKQGSHTGEKRRNPGRNRRKKASAQNSGKATHSGRVHN